MNTYSYKKLEKKSQSPSNVDKSTAQFVDNRPEAIAQRQLLEMPNVSPQVKQAAQLQAMFNNSPQVKHATQLQDMANNQPIQKASAEPSQNNNTGLPDNLKTGMENLSGMPLDDVKVHRNSDKPAQLQAHAFAQGSNIHLGPGQEKHLPHEAWHVVQQKQGRVKPTVQMNGGVNVNDDAGLEKEADKMGANALQMKSVQPSKGKAASTSAAQTVQLQPMEKMVTGITHLVKLMDGSLYNSNFQFNEGAEMSHGTMVEIDTNTRYRSRRGPNQESFSQQDEGGEQLYLWYKVNSVNGVELQDNYYIREDTITHPMQAKALEDPLQKTIYGTDGSNATEVGDAYKDGYRDFDCAFGYHKGGSYRFFRSFDISPERPVRIIYKFKLEDVAEAAVELAKLSRTSGVIIHSVMLHEIPDQTADIDTALQHLALLGQTYHSLVGVSNVSLTEAGGPADLQTIRENLRSRGLDMSVVENKMNPAVTDRVVRNYCRKTGIQYLAYGLTGPSSSGGTCGMVPGTGDGDYMILSDPGLLSLAEQLNINAGDLRYVIYTWARQKKVNIIARSSKKDRRLKNGKDFHVEGIETLESYSQVHETGLYLPFYQHLTGMGVPGSRIRELVGLIPLKWLDKFYRKAIVDLKSDNLTPILQDVEKFKKLKATISSQKWKDITAMREYFDTVLREEVTHPVNPTSAELIQFLRTSGLMISDENWELGPEIEKLATDDIVYIHPFGDYTTRKTYTKQSDGSWKGPE